jgi:hypothetical protein
LDNFKSFESLLSTVNVSTIDDIALRLFRFQAKHNPVYARYIDHLRVDPDKIDRIADIPFLPISFFKTQTVKTGDWNAEAQFTSSGTTGPSTSVHYVANLSLYTRHAQRCFEHFFGPLNQYHIFALMPSYLERENSSLIEMIRSFIKESESSSAGFYLYDYDKLMQDIAVCKKQAARKILLWGVSFALLDVAEKYHPDLSDCFIFETGGMKGRRKEVTRNELHDTLTTSFGVGSIYSEYGMTELLSQAYTRGGERFYPPPAMKILTRDIADPFDVGFTNRVGGLNVIDLANIYSIAFIETEDIGKVWEDGSFEVNGRLDNSDIRGCNLLVE